MAFNELGIKIDFRGEGVNEKGFVAECSSPDFQIEIGKQVVAVDHKYFRPTEVDVLIGDPTKSRTKLGWTPKYSLKSLVQEMILSDIEQAKRGKLLIDAGYHL